MTDKPKQIVLTSIAPTGPEQTFLEFPRLPKELRLDIWTIAAREGCGRLHRLRLVQPGDDGDEAVVRATPVVDPAVLLPPVQGYASTSSLRRSYRTAINLSRVCWESRMELLRCLSFEVPLERGIFRCNLEYDIICVQEPSPRNEIDLAAGVSLKRLFLESPIRFASWKLVARVMRMFRVLAESNNGPPTPQARGIIFALVGKLPQTRHVSFIFDTKWTAALDEAEAAAAREGQTEYFFSKKEATEWFTNVWEPGRKDQDARISAQEPETCQTMEFFRFLEGVQPSTKESVLSE